MLNDAADASKKTDKRNKEVISKIISTLILILVLILKNCATFVECTREINNTQINHAKDLDFVMTMYNLIEYSNNYSQTSGSFWKFNRDESALNDDGNIVDLPGNSASLKLNGKITGKTPLMIIKNMLKWQYH